VLRILSVLIAPVLVRTPPIIRAQLNISDTAITTWESAKQFGQLPRTVVVAKGAAAFPRAEKP